MTQCLNAHNCEGIFNDKKKTIVIIYGINFLYFILLLLLSSRPRSEHVEVGGGEKVLNVAVCRSVTGLVATHAAPHTVRVTHLHSNKVPIAAHLKV